MSCVFPDCKSRVHGRGRYCPAHWKQKASGKPMRPVLKKSYSTNPVERLKEKCILSSSGCWEWTAGKNAGGYGRITFKGKVTLAHRLSYQTFCGPIPDGVYVCHHCDNPSCINPDHLWLGTNSDNILDCSKKGRHPLHNKSHCIRGHPRDRYKSGACKECVKLAAEARRKRLVSQGLTTKGTVRIR